MPECEMSEDLAILEKIAKKFKDGFGSIRENHYNPNTKGYDYEETVEEFYKKYLGNFFDFYMRVPIYDANLEFRKLFRNEENEFDVVATYKNALPKIVMEIHKRQVIPYDAVAFVTEVKQTLTKPHLESDMDKLRRLSLLKLGQNVFIPPIRTQFSLARPLRILFYFERKVNEKLLWNSLAKSEHWCDFLVVADEDKVFLNRQLPITKQIVSNLKKQPESAVLEQTHALLKLMYYLTMTIRYPILVNAWGIFETLFSK
jgi:hypothetical protein